MRNFQPKTRARRKLISARFGNIETRRELRKVNRKSINDKNKMKNVQRLHSDSDADDCLLIEVPREIIVIDDENEKNNNDNINKETEAVVKEETKTTVKEETKAMVEEETKSMVEEETKSMVEEETKAMVNEETKAMVNEETNNPKWSQEESFITIDETLNISNLDNTSTISNENQDPLEIQNRDLLKKTKTKEYITLDYIPFDETTASSTEMNTVIQKEDDAIENITLESTQSTEENKTCEEINQSKEDGELTASIIEPTVVSNEKLSEDAENLQTFLKDASSATIFGSMAPLYDTINSSTSFRTILGASEINSDDDKTIKNESFRIKKSKKKQNLDDSVIFVGESIDLDSFKPASKALDFIPLPKSPVNQKSKNKRVNPSELVLNPFKKFRIEHGNSSTPVSKKQTGEILFTSSEKKKNQNYNSNVYNPSGSAEVKKTQKRMVILDGSNIGFSHGLSKHFSIYGLEIALNYFKLMGHEVKAVVPNFRISSGEKLDELHRNGLIVYTPGKNLPGLRVSSYDDRFILQLASEFDAAIVSNDNYRDLINENPGFKKIIENRVITYTWCNDMFIMAKDPYGKNGPHVDQILNRL